MNKDDRIFLSTFLTIFLVGLLSAIFFIKAQCHARYEPSYAPVSWGIVQGCMATFNGKHIPVERIREQVND